MHAPFRNRLAAGILLADGILLVVLAFVHLLATPLIHKWLSHELTAETLLSVSPAFLLDHVVVGVLLIPFGVSTLYSAAGVRLGHSWARSIAATNAFAVMILPLLVLVFLGRRGFDSALFLWAGVLISIIGMTMLIPLIWLGKRDE